MILTWTSREMSGPLTKESGADSKAATSEIWQEAFASLNENEREQINASNKWEQGTLKDVSCSGLRGQPQSHLYSYHATLVLIVISQVLHDVQTKADDCTKKRWKFVRHTLPLPLRGFHNRLSVHYSDDIILEGIVEPLAKISSSETFSRKWQNGFGNSSKSEILL